MTSDELAQRARDILTEKPDSAVLSKEKMIGLIPTAVKMLIASLPSHKQARFRQNFNVTITSGVADLSDAVDNGLLADNIKSSDIVLSYEPGNPILQTVQFVDSYDRLTQNGIQDRFFVLAFLDGNNLIFKNPSDLAINTLDTSGTIKGLCAPSDVGELPAEFDADLVLMVAELGRKEIGMDQRRRIDRTQEQPAQS